MTFEPTSLGLFLHAYWPCSAAGMLRVQCVRVLGHMDL